MNATSETAWRKAIRARSKTCEKCPSTFMLECAHVVGRGRAPSLKLDLENGRVLCHECHVRFTNHPLDGDAWIESKWPGLIDMLRQRDNDSRKVGCFR